MSAVLRFSWRVVGGNAPFVRFLIPTCYFYAAFAIASAIHQLFAYGIAKVWDVELYNLLLTTFKDKRVVNAELQAHISAAIESAKSGDSRKLIVFAVYELVLLVGLIAIIAWVIVAWGAYRELTGLSRKKSFVAGILSLALGSVVVGFLYYVYVTLT